MDSPQPQPQPQPQPVQANSEAVDVPENKLQNLPREVGTTNEPFYLYKGFWYNMKVLEALMYAQQNFKAQATDIMLVTAPKSGTTWLKAFVFAITQRIQHPISDQHHPLLTNSPHGLVPFIQLLFHPDNKLPDFSTTLSPRLFAAHAPYSMLPESVKTSKCRIIYMCRNPKDIFVSFWYFVNTFIPNPLPVEQVFEKFCKGLTWNGPVWDQALEYWKLSLERPEEVLFLKYEDLKGDITCQLKKIADFLGYPFSLKEVNERVIEGIARVCSFQHLSNLEVNRTGQRAMSMAENKDFFRKGVVGDWMNLLTPSMAQQLDRVVDQKLMGSGLILN